MRDSIRPAFPRRKESFIYNRLAERLTLRTRIGPRNSHCIEFQQFLPFLKRRLIKLPAMHSRLPVLRSRLLANSGFENAGVLEQTAESVLIYFIREERFVSSYKLLLKSLLPRPLRLGLRAGLGYVNRVGRWPMILLLVRGVEWKDTRILFMSAIYSPFASLKNLSKWQDPFLLVNCSVNVRGVGRFDLRSRCDDLWHALPTRERAIFQTIVGSLRVWRCFYRCGSKYWHLHGIGLATGWSRRSCDLY